LQDEIALDHDAPHDFARDIAGPRSSEHG